MATDAKPRLSVVIPSYRAQDTIESCLDALTRQTFDGFEVIVVDSSPDGRTAELVRGRFPQVILIAASERLWPHAARNRGAERASGEMIVFSDPDCEGRPDWLERLVAEQRAGAGIVGGAVEPWRAGWFERGVHWCKFGPWRAGGRAGERAILPTANLAWSRTVWEEVGPFRLGGWSGDAELAFRARRAGHSLRFCPDAIVEHHHLTDPPSFWRERRERGRAFAALRARTERWSRVRALAHVVGTPAVPVLLVVRSLRRAQEVRRLADGLVTLPVQLLGYTAWALGELRASWEAARARPNGGSDMVEG